MNRVTLISRSFSVVGALGVASALLVSSSARAADPTAAEILKSLDHATSCYEDLSTDVKMSVFEGGATKGREFTFVQTSKGQKRIVKFTSGSDKGMGFLSEGAETLYAYLPDMKRVRRLGTHVGEQSVLGSDLTNADMSDGNGLAANYTPTLVGSEGEAWIIELQAKPEKKKDVVFSKLKIWVDKKIHQSLKVEEYDSSGKLARTQERTGYKLDEGSTDHYSPSEIKYVDLKRNGHSTKLQFTTAKANQKVSDDLFTQRTLIRQ